jgi:hypothetical protein
MGAETLDDQLGLKYVWTNSTTTPEVPIVRLDLDMRAGTVNTNLQSSTAWQDGGAAAGSYPGAITGFTAKNANTTNATGSLRMVILQVDLKHASATTLDISASTNDPASFTEIVGIVGHTGTATGCKAVLTDADTVTITPEAVLDGFQITLLVQ